MLDELGHWRMALDLTERDDVTKMRLTHHLDETVDPADMGPGWEYSLDNPVAARAGEPLPRFAVDDPALRPPGVAVPCSMRECRVSRRGDAAMPSSQTGTPALQGFLDAFNAHDVDAIMSFFAEDCVFDMPRGPAPGGRRLVGKEQVREGIQSRFDGIPDVRYDDDSHWVCGDRGVSEWTIRGTHRTGERIEVRGCDLFEFADGKITRKDSFWKIVD